MSALVPLGRLEAVPLRQAWPDEARNFTPWLSEEANLAVLGETLGLQLELEATERSVGSFAADILAKEVGTDHWVLIENQIEPTDHRHLGQLLTYAAGLDARTIIWIAEGFRDEHRAALDFLNAATTEEFAFFGLQIELYRIGESQLAPRFSVIVKPNRWSKSAQATKRAAEVTLTPTEALSREFWGLLISKALDSYPQLAGKAPSKLNWQVAESIKSGKGFYFSSNAAFTRDGRLRVEAYIGNPLAKAAFHALAADKAAIERRFGASLDWEELPAGQDSRIAFYMDGKQERSDRTAWPRQHQWLLATWPKLANAIRESAIRLNADELESWSGRMDESI